MGSKAAAALQSPEPKPGTPSSPCSLKKDVLLGEWWLRRSEKEYNGRSIAVGGYCKRGDAVRILNSAPIIKRHDHVTLETADGITLRIQGSFNQKRTLDNGFPLEDAATFLFGFPITWDDFFIEFSGNKPLCQQLLEPERETTFEPSFEQKTVLLRDWWLRRTEKEYEGNMLGVGGFTEWGKARRLFNSSPIIIRHDAYTLETADGITIRIQGLINKTRTLDNGFSLKACRIFLIGFPTTWANFANESSESDRPHAETPLSASRCHKRSNGSLVNMAFGSPSPSKNRILDDDVPSTSNTFFLDSTSRYLDIIQKFTSLASFSDTEHMPSVDRVFNHLPEKSSCENDQLQVAESSETNMRNAYTVDNDSEHHEAGRTEGAECRTCDVHADGVLQDHKLGFTQDATFQSVKKQSGCALTKGHHCEGSGTCSTGDSRDSVVGKDLDKEEVVYEKDEKCDESSSRTSKKARSGSSKLENLLGEDLKVAESPPQPTRRSTRLMLLKLLNIQGEYQDYSQFPSKTNDLDSANLTLDASNSSRTSQANDTVATGILLSPTRGTPLPSSVVLSAENGDAHQHSRNTGLAVASKSNSTSKYGCNYTSAARDLWQSSNDRSSFSSDHRAGVVEEETPTNSNASTSKALERMMMMPVGKKNDSETIGRKRKDNKKASSIMKVEQNGFRNQLYFTSSEENISFKSSNPNSGKKENMKRNPEDAKKLEGVIDMQQTEDKAYCTTRYEVVWVSSYTDVHRTPPLTRNNGKKISIHTPESLNLKRSRSGRVLIPQLDCSTRIVYEADGSIIGTAAVAASLSPFKGSGKKSVSRMRKRRQ